MDVDPESINLAERGTPSATPRRQPSRATWTSCCLTVDRQMAVWLGQLVVSMSVLAFAAHQIQAAEGSCDRASAAWGIISFILGRTLSAVVDSTNA